MGWLALRDAHHIPTTKEPALEILFVHVKRGSSYPWVTFAGFVRWLCVVLLKFWSCLCRDSALAACGQLVSLGYLCRDFALVCVRTFNSWVALAGTLRRLCVRRAELRQATRHSLISSVGS